MPDKEWNNVRTEVLNYFAGETQPVQISDLATRLRNQHLDLSGLRDADFRDVIQAMIASGRLRYAPGLRIQAGRPDIEHVA